LDPEPFLRRDSRDEGWLRTGLAKSRGCPRADCGDSGQLASGATEQLLGAEGAGDDHPVVAVDVDAGRPGRLELDQRTADDLVAEPLDAAGERLELLTRPGDDHAQPPRGGSHP